MTNPLEPSFSRLVYAGLWHRFLALFADFLVLCVLFFPATKITKGVWLMGPSDHRWANGLFVTDPLCFALLFVMLVYFVLLEGLAGATIGKLIVGIKVVAKLDGGRPGLTKALSRNVLRIVDGLPAFNIVGVALILRSNERARFGDIHSGTRVVFARGAG